MSNTIISILSGLGAMFGWGMSDFFASFASVKVGNLKSFFWAQLTGLVFIFLVLVLIFPDSDFKISYLPLILLSVVGYMIGYLFYYKSFEIGNLSIVSVVINLNAVFTMLVAYFVRGQRLTSLQIPAVILVILGLVLVSINFDDLFKSKGISLLKGVKEAIIASFGFGVLCWPATDYLVEKMNWIWEALIVKVFAVIAIFIFMSLTKKV